MEKVNKKKRALVLGGSGQMGRAWLSGLLSKLIEDGVQLPKADLIIGTSAGSQIGAQLVLGILDLKNPPAAPATYFDISSSPSDIFAQMYSLMAQASESSTSALFIYICAVLNVSAFNPTLRQYLRQC